MDIESAAASRHKEEDLLHQFQRILHDDPLIDEVGFLHPTQFQSLHHNANSTSHFWCVEHKLPISFPILPDLYRAARHACSNATNNHAAAAALIMTHTKALLILCPDSLTAWNSRKMALSTNHHLKQLQDELHLCALILSYAPKNESTWSHRRWVIKKLSQHHQDMSALIHKESLLVKQIAEKSKMNYRAWRHRCWLIPFMKTKQVPAACINCQSEAHLLWKEELRWNEMLIRRYQGRESLWIHRRFLSQWWVQHLFSSEEACPLKESLVDLFLDQEIHLLSDCLNAPGDEFGEARAQAELAALYILWISKQDVVVKRNVEETLQSVGSLKEALARACPEKSRLWTELLQCSS